MARYQLCIIIIVIIIKQFLKMPCNAILAGASPDRGFFRSGPLS